MFQEPTSPRGRAPWADLVLIAVFVSVLLWQLNMVPLERHGFGLDSYWGDARLMGMLGVLDLALRHGELPILDLFTNFGWHLGGDLASVWNPLNALILVFPPTAVLLLRTWILLTLAGLGTYFFVGRVGATRPLALATALAYVTLPIVTGFFLYSPFSFCVHTAPLVLLALHLFLENATLGRFAFLYVVFGFSATVGEFNSLPATFVSVVAYCILAGWLFFRKRLAELAGLSLVVVLSYLLAGASYYAPLAENLWQRSLEVQRFVKAGLLANPEAAARSEVFWTLFLQAKGSFHRFFEGSGMVLFAPKLWVAAALLGHCVGRSEDTKPPWRWRSLVLVLLLLAALMPLEPFLLYHPLVLRAFPFIAQNATGTVRYQVNLIPAFLVLAGGLGLTAVVRVHRASRFFTLSAALCVTALLIDMTAITGRYLPRVNPGPNRLDLVWLYHHRIFPLLSLAIALACLWFARRAQGGVTVRGRLVGYAGLGVLFLLMATFHNAVYVRFGQTTASRSSALVDGFRQREACLDTLIDRFDPNWRTIYPNTGGELAYGSLFENELHTLRGISMLFAYRELDLPFVEMLNRMSNVTPRRPGDVERVASRPDLLRFMGVRYVVSFDRAIDHPGFLFRGRCTTPTLPRRLFPEGALYTNPTDTAFVYELRSPRGIAFTVDRGEIHSLAESVQAIDSDADRLAQEGIVWIDGPEAADEVPPVDATAARLPIATTSQVSDIHRTSQSFAFHVRRATAGWAVLGLAWRPGWHAYVNGTERSIRRANGGFMTVAVPAGEHQVLFRYRSTITEFGMGASALALVAGMAAVGFFRRQKSARLR